MPVGAAQLSRELVAGVGDRDLEDAASCTAAAARRSDAGEPPASSLNGLGLRGPPAQVDDRDAEVLAEGGREVTLVEGAELDEQRPEPLARHPLLEQGIVELGRA